MLHQKRSSIEASRKAGSQAGFLRHDKRDNLYTPPPPVDDSDEALEWRRSARKLADEANDERRQLMSPRQHQLFGYEPEFDQVRRRQQEEADEESLSNSSISFAQSGCHSILSAWRLKAANKSGRSNRGSTRRPLSVLSTASSRKSALSSVTNTTMGRGKSPASNSRIPLGPKASQHFVTNSKRRRRANELILNTLEVRRRILDQQAPSEVLGSLSYLAEPGRLDQCSLSQSPVAGEHPSLANRRSPQRPTLSDIGLQADSGPSSAAHEQRERILRRATSSPDDRAPPRAKLDQNSSDLCSSVTSDDGGSSLASRSSESQFTQLMSAELAPDCIQRLLDKAPPKPAARRRDVELVAPKPPASELSEGRQLRRGALRRDSIRRLRLNRSSQSQEGPQEAPQPTNRPVQLESLPKSRRIDIENNPFLNRHHFRTTSARGSLLQAEQARPTSQLQSSELWSSRDSLRPQQPKPAPRPESGSKSPSRARQQVDQTDGAPNDEPSRASVSTTGWPKTASTRPPDKQALGKPAGESGHDLRLNSYSTRSKPSSPLEEHFRLESNLVSISEQLELIRSTSISPPIEFADPPKQPPLRRSVSEERPNPRARIIPVARPPVAPRPPQKGPEPAKKPDVPELPKFERTGDDEFRKRVDYLRRLARANLADSERAPERAGSSARPTTRPLSTNWSGPAGSAGSNQSPATPLGSWGRSNSSLAAFGRPRPNPQPEVQRSASPASSLQPHQSGPAAIKLVVRERSQPKLDCAAFVKEPNQTRPQSPIKSTPIQAPSKPPRPPRVASPRSPEFTAASSNDASAIASSVSSPSLSFVPPTPSKRPTETSSQPSRGHPASIRLAAGSGTLQSILRRQQQLQGQQVQLSDSSDSSAGQPNQARLPASPEPVQPVAAPIKRVHFSDRTSIRSFESVSSLTESGSTTVPASDLLRRQLGSPDSMNSASSASRLSTDSPDLRSRAGAAIYAVRDDPELELDAPVPLQLGLPPPASYLVGSAYLPPGAIRMTAPPSISTAPRLQPPASYLAGQRPPAVPSRAPIPAEEDEEDPSYVMRIRQAATSGVFNYAPPAAVLSPPARPAQQAGRRPAPVDLRLLNFQTEV